MELISVHEGDTPHRKFLSNCQVLWFLCSDSPMVPHFTHYTHELKLYQGSYNSSPTLFYNSYFNIHIFFSGTSVTLLSWYLFHYTEPASAQKILNFNFSLPKMSYPHKSMSHLPSFLIDLCSNLTFSEKQFLFINIRMYPSPSDPMLFMLCLYFLWNTNSHLWHNYIFLIFLCLIIKDKFYISLYLLMTDWIFSSISSEISWG